MINHNTLTYCSRINEKEAEQLLNNKRSGEDQAKDQPKRRHASVKRIVRRLKNPILGILTLLAVIAMIFGAGYVQNDMYVKGGMLFAFGFCWVLLFLKANPEICWTPEACTRCMSTHCENYCPEDDSGDVDEYEDI